MSDPVRTVVFSDVHGNAIALEAFLSSPDAVADRYVCLGDMVNYGPWGDECVERIGALTDVTMIRGNHEEIFLGRVDPSELSALVQDFTAVARARFTRFDLIDGLPVEATVGSFTCAHTIDDTRVYRDTPVVIDRDRIIGHSHQSYVRQVGGHTLVNTGSIGQNRGQMQVAEWVVFDADAPPRRCSAEWDVDALLQEMARLGYPDPCIDYYRDRVATTRK